MPPHNWQRGDSLSDLAAANGLESWRRIWNDSTNDALRNRRGSPENLRVGDIVEIPVPRVGEVARPVNARANFVRVGVPPASIRIISDGGNPAEPNPTELSVLQVSNLVTTQRLPTGFNQASADPRNFKIEVRDLGAGGNTVQAEVEVLKARLDVSHRPERDLDGELRHESFGTRRLLNVQLRRVPGLANTFRSRYLRLVVDNADQGAPGRAQQVVLADHDPADLHVEILDQLLTARYTAASGEPLATQAYIGDSERRIRVVVFVLRPTFNAAGLVGGLTTADVERHVGRWVRRVYAQANMAPRLVDPGVMHIDPVENMLWIRATDRRNALGNRRVRIRVNTAPAPTTLSINTVAGERPEDIANRLAQEAQNNLPVTYLADVFNNKLSYVRTESADLLITNITGVQVILDQAQSLDPRIRLTVGRTRPNSTRIATRNWWNVGNAENRALARNYRRRQDAVAVIVINRFAPVENCLGYAYGRQFRVAVDFQGEFPMAGCCFVEARTVTPADRHPIVMAHEMGHILADMFHFTRQTELMVGDGFPWRNNLWGPKRISDRVISYREPVPWAERNFPINPMQELRDREQAQYIEGWDEMLST